METKKIFKKAMLEVNYIVKQPDDLKKLKPELTNDDTVKIVDEAQVDNMSKNKLGKELTIGDILIGGKQSQSEIVDINKESLYNYKVTIKFNDNGKEVTRTLNLDPEKTFGVMNYQKNLGENEELNEKDCWKGYKKEGTKMKDGKKVNNCVPTNENWEPLTEQDWKELSDAMQESINPTITKQNLEQFIKNKNE